MAQNSPDDLSLELTGTIIFPAWRNAPVSISAPFDADGFFRHHDRLTGNLLFQVPIRRRRHSDAQFGARGRPEHGLGTFRYDFVATPTPEPATLTMVGAPLVAALIRARKRRDRRPLFSCQRARRRRNCVPSFEREATVHLSERSPYDD